MDNALHLPEYQSHKRVRAARITEIREDGTLVFGELGREARPGAAWINRHNPVEGGYYVIYSDGYTSFSPAAAFEEGYTQVAA